MSDEYEFIEHELADDVTVYCLAPKSSNGDFVEKWIHNVRQQESLDNFTAVIRKIVQRGVTAMVHSKKLRLVEHSLSLYEVKNYFSSQRVMAVIQGEIILLLQYDAHRGGNKNNDPVMMKRARKLAAIAQELFEREFGGLYGNQER